MMSGSCQPRQKCSSPRFEKLRKEKVCHFVTEQKPYIQCKQFSICSYLSINLTISAEFFRNFFMKHTEMCLFKESAGEYQQGI